MTVGLPVLSKCPECRTIFVQEVFDSYTLFPGRYWSDGYSQTSGPNPALSSPVFRCRRCAHWQRFDEAETLFELPLHVDPVSVPRVPAVPVLNEAEINDALSQEWPDFVEARLRTHLLWILNHPRRTEDGRQLMTRELMENLERLIEVFEPAADPLFAAECYREMGDFPSAKAIVDAAPQSELDEWDLHRLELLSISVADQSIDVYVIDEIEESEPDNDLPVVPVCEAPGHRQDETPISSQELDRLISEGFYPFPPVEDVFAFPTDQKEENECPILSVSISDITHEYGDWATILGPHDDRSLLRRGRVFREGEWEMYRRAPESRRQDLEWFWRQSSHAMNASGKSADRYYRILYQIFYGMHDPITGTDLDQISKAFITHFNRRFDAYYRGFNASDDYYLFYWSFFWALIGGHIDEDWPDTIDLDEQRQSYRNYAFERRYRQAQAVEGLSDFKTGAADWFHSVDKTPHVNGNPCDFVGQIWLDCMNAGTTLVYLFVDPVTGTQVQTFDYD